MEGAQPQESEAQPRADLGFLSALADSMVKEEDRTIFRRFDKLNLLQLLVLQDEIQGLMDQLAEQLPLTRSDAQTEADENAWYTLVRPTAAHKDPTAQSQINQRQEARTAEIWETLKGKLKEYNAALMDLARLRSLEPPSAQHIKALRLELDEMMTQSRQLRNPAACWDAAHEDDFAAIRSGTSKGGRFGMWIALGIEIIKWELWGRHSATIDPNSVPPRVISLGKKRPRISKSELARKHAFVSRFVMALFGGIALIVPTVIMAKTQGINVSLITTSVAVVLFGIALAFGATDSTGKDVLAATAAYTAVLVVFVGTSLSGGAATTADPAVPGNSTSTP
ncbi:hypothetical protein QBC47DRAFT_376246 [Echria macrotheca]|uniref:DUF6594 domain-containing protein n=1 Tax=Echria macrotheca TaxID=438768 RepID=A0AAJ0BFV3_9PEZI|nr:hypothetical protein QBC47DRAFT_376246 [Echria macrotheca]